MYTRTYKVFYEKGDLRNYFEKKLKKLEEEIRREPEDYILNVNEDEYINYKVSQYEIDLLEIDIDKAYADHREELISSEQLSPHRFYLDKKYSTMVIYFYIPVRGDTELLYYRPSRYIVWTQDVSLINNEIVFRVIHFDKDVNNINMEFERFVNRIKEMERCINEDVVNFNNSLKFNVRSWFTSRKQDLLKRKNILSGLKVPLIKKENVPKTFSIPTPELRKKIVVKPVVTEVGYKPEPVLDMTIYKEILRMINDMGKEFERKPSVYSNKSEEQLRDHFLMLLEPNFDGSATGETFNKNGKTDILLRYEGNNVFIAECKFWKGKGNYHKTIDQLLSYLTWRDSKAAIIIFVKNKEFSNVLHQIENETPRHPNYLGFVNKDDENWFNYRFHIVGDKNREIKLAVMLYHIPNI